MVPESPILSRQVALEMIESLVVAVVKNPQFPLPGPWWSLGRRSTGHNPRNRMVIFSQHDLVAGTKRVHELASPTLVRSSYIATRRAFQSNLLENSERSIRKKTFRFHYHKYTGTLLRFPTAGYHWLRQCSTCQTLVVPCWIAGRQCLRLPIIAYGHPPRTTAPLASCRRGARTQECRRQNTRNACGTGCSRRQIEHG